ncbi:MAG: hypothetical protein ACD_74C00052G0002 [uncultured bacterium]|nr:MAG: hypothetical protein ACD_74C00052G0002 [uncultured bacterium]
MAKNILCVSMKSILVRLYWLDAGLKHPGNTTICRLKKVCPPDHTRRDERDGSGEGGAWQDTGHEQSRGGQEPLWHTVNRWEKNGSSARKVERCTTGNTVSGQ